MEKIECPNCKTQIEVILHESTLDLSDKQEVEKRQKGFESMIPNWPEECLQMMVDQCERTRDLFAAEIKRRKQSSSS